MQLLTNALLGTDKMPLQATVLPPVIAEYLQKAPAESPEATFLKAATLFYAYQKAGEEAPKLQIPEYKPAPEETRPVCPAHFSVHFKQENDPQTTVLLPHIIDKCLKNNWSVASNDLVNLLNIGKRKELPAWLKAKIVELAGDKGVWLAQFNPEWNYVQTEAAEVIIWDEGSVDQRIELLKQHRIKNPDAALAMLEPAWKECSTRERKSFLKVLSINLNINDEPFLNSVYTDILAQKESNSGVKGEIKKIVVDLLLSLPDSQKQTEIFEKLTTYFTKKTGLFGFGKSEFILNLPEAQDDFFNQNTMRTALGRTFLNTTNHSDAEWWFKELVSYIPPRKWADFLQKTPEDTVLFFKKNMTTQLDKKFSFAFSAFGHAILLQEDREMAFEYLKVWKKTHNKAYRGIYETHLFKLLTSDELDIILKNSLIEISVDAIADYFPKTQWKQETSNYVALRMVTESIDAYANTTKQVTMAFLPYFHPQTVFWVENYCNSLQKDYQKARITEGMLEPMRYFFEQKRLIEDAK